MSQTTTEPRAARDGSRGGAEPRRERSRWALLVYGLFFLSGLTSLIYEVIWVRQFGVVFGVTTYATTTVLAAFFAGLAIGSYSAGRIIDRGKLHPLVVYGAMEGAVGLYAVVLPFLMKLLERTYPTVYSHMGENFSLFTLFRFLASFAVLVIPTTLMGATLPVLSKLMVHQENELGVNVGRLYAINTFGAVAGSITAGYFLVQFFGVPNTIWIAAVGNFLLAAGALALSQSAAFREVQVPKAEVKERRPRSGTERLTLALAFTTGLAILALEVAWTKSLVLILGWTAYAFATMLTAVLIGIALGSALFARNADTAPNRGALVALLITFGGLCAFTGPLIVNKLPFVFLKLWDWTGGVFWLLIVAQFVVCFLLVFIPTLLSGASFPILVRMHSHGEKEVGSTVADVYSVNTFGGILGSLLGGFVLVRYFGEGGTIVIASLLLIGAGGLLAIALAKPWSVRTRTAASAALVVVVIVLAVAHPSFDKKLIYAGWGPFAGGYSQGRDGTTVDVASRYMTRLLYHKEGVSAAVDVAENGYGMQFISINAQPVATTYMPDMRALKMLGHLPVLLHPDPEEVLIIGLGAGVSTGIISSYPEVNHVTVVELNEEVPDGTAKFRDWNFDVIGRSDWRKPGPSKIHVVINDGANFVKATKKKYDFISSDPIHPFISGNGILYSQDHWQYCSDKLNDGGVIAQWIPLYQLSPTDWATIIHSFTSVFPNSSMWYSGIDVVLIGFKGDVKIDPDRMAKKMSDPVIARDLLSMGVHGPGDVFGWFIAGPEQLQEMGAGAPINTVDRPVLEYTAPRALALQSQGVSPTMPALLTAFEDLSLSNPRDQINALCTRPLTPQELMDASTTQLANQWVMRAMILDSNGASQQYLQAMERARALRPKDQFISEALSEAQTRYADTVYEDGDSQTALDLYRNAFLNDPTSITAAAGAAQCALDLGEDNVARTVLDSVQPGQRNVLQVLVYKGTLELRANNYEAAREALTTAETQGQESPYMHIGLGILALKDGDHAAAYQHFDRGLAVATGQLDVLYSIVSLSKAHGFEGAIHPYAEQLVDMTTSSIAENPTSRLLYTYRAFGYEVLGDRVLAQRDRTAASSLTGWWQ